MAGQKLVLIAFWTLISILNFEYFKLSAHLHETSNIKNVIWIPFIRYGQVDL